MSYRYLKFGTLDEIMDSIENHDLYNDCCVKLENSYTDYDHGVNRKVFRGRNIRDLKLNFESDNNIYDIRVTVAFTGKTKRIIGEIMRCDTEYKDSHNNGELMDRDYEGDIVEFRYKYMLTYDLDRHDDLDPSDDGDDGYSYVMEKNTMSYESGSFGVNEFYIESFVGWGCCERKIRKDLDFRWIRFETKYDFENGGLDPNDSHAWENHTNKYYAEDVSSRSFYLDKNRDQKNVVLTRKYPCDVKRDICVMLGLVSN